MLKKRLYTTPNSAPQLANAGVQVDALHYEAHRLKSVQLIFDDASRRWLVLLGSGNPIPATDVEVTLWLRLQEALETQSTLVPQG